MGKVESMADLLQVVDNELYLIPFHGRATDVNGQPIIVDINLTSIDMSRTDGRGHLMALYEGENRNWMVFDLETRTEEGRDEVLRGGQFLEWGIEFFGQMGHSTDKILDQWSQIFDTETGQELHLSDNFTQYEMFRTDGAPMLDAVDATWAGAKFAELGYELAGNVEYRQSIDENLIDARYEQIFVKTKHQNVER